VSFSFGFFGLAARDEDFPTGHAFFDRLNSALALSPFTSRNSPAQARRRKQKALAWVPGATQKRVAKRFASDRRPGI
jgi:hypothetical protein